jgi:hypothetical protein
MPLDNREAEELRNALCMYYFRLTSDTATPWLKAATMLLQAIPTVR